MTFRADFRLAVGTVALAGCLVGANARADVAPGEVGPEGVVLAPPQWPIYADIPANTAGATPAPTPAPAAAGSQTLLMQALDPTPVGKGLEKARINIFGYVEGSYEYNFQHPQSFTFARSGGTGTVPLNNGRLFDIYQHDKVYLNQVNLTIERQVDLTSHQFDVGGRVESVFGQDARFIHANGLLDHQQGSIPGTPQIGGEYQYDLYQAYLDFAVPFGNGVRVRLGKFKSVKDINPNASVFYTHSFAAAASFPFTETGITVMYPFSDRLQLEAGISRGWDQALKDNNGAIDGLANLNWQLSDTTTLSAFLIVGPELPHNNHDYSTLFDVALKQSFSNRFAVFIDARYGHQVHPILGTPPGSPSTAQASTTLGTANWYGVTGIALYSVNDYLDVAARAEWYRDEEGLTTGLPGGQNLYEATLGATVYPVARTILGRNFQLRPEVRYDYSSRLYFKFDPTHPQGGGLTGFQKHDQLTFAIDAIFNF